MSNSLNPAQVALYNRLNGNIPGVEIFDDPPDVPAKMPSQYFPYIHIGEDLVVRWDTDSHAGSIITINLYVWSQQEGSKEVKNIMGQVYDLLHRQPAALNVSGFDVVDCLFDFAQVNDMSDGITRQGVCRYRVTLQKE